MSEITQPRGIMVLVDCPSCGGTGKGPTRSFDVDGNNNWQSNDACDRCLARKTIKEWWSPGRLREALDA